MGLFGEFTEVTEMNGDRPDISAMLKKTQECLANDEENICEASFSYNGLYCAVDILRKEDGGHAIYEVKSSTHEAEIYGIDIAYQGLMVSVLVLVSYFVGHFMESGAWEIANSPDGTTMAFLTMSMAEIFHSFNMRSQRGSIFRLRGQNTFLLGASILALIATTLVCEVPALAGAFGFTSINLAEYVIALALGALVIPIVEGIKFVQRKLAK